MLQKSLAVLLVLTFAIFTGESKAATIAVIDSGTDLLHKELADKAWVNVGEIANSGSDDDGNGYIDDLNGWNFAENNNKLIDYSYLGTLTPDIRRFFEVQALSIRGLASEADLAWMKAKIQDQEFVKKLSVFGNFMHGTHVAGIAARDVDTTAVMPLKLIPTEVKLPFSVFKNAKNDFGIILFKLALSQLAKQQMKVLETVAQYVGQQGAEVANGSFGTGYPQAEMIIEALFGGVMGREPTESELHELASYFIDIMIREGQHMVAAAPRSLFVFAAGNDGLDNDKFPASPTNIEANNVISVAATIDRAILAKFSNYGEKMVDVAAPGVAVNAPVPGNDYLKVSGTSQAAPYVANVAAQVADYNSALGPAEIKKIILSTVDYKEFLKGKVKTGGLVNPARAARAAELSKKVSLALALEQARVEVQDIPETKAIYGQEQTLPGMVLPLTSQFKF